MLRPQSPSSTSTARILVLDDEPVLAKFLGEMLGLRGHVPTLCYSVQQALELVRCLDFDLILCDYRMPFMNGKEFFHAVSLVKPALAQRFIFLTGDHVQDETRAFFVSTGNPYLAKPFPLATLETLVANLLRDRNHPEVEVGESADCLELSA